MGYTDLVNAFQYKDPWYWQRHDALAENDKDNLIKFSSARRPVLKYVSATAIDVEANGIIPNQTKIIFPDNDVRSVVENTAVTSSNRRFIITETAEFVSGSENSGLRSGLSENGLTPEWFCIYAVKSQMSTSSFVLVGDRTLPLASNYSTLNTRYGALSWVYLGLFYNAAPAGGGFYDIFPFVQSGHRTIFTVGDANSTDLPGAQFSSGVLNPKITFTPSAGMGTTQIPQTIGQGMWSFRMTGAGNNNSTLVTVKDGGEVYAMKKLTVVKSATEHDFYCTVKGDALSGVAAITDYSAGSSDIGVISLLGFYDMALAVGLNFEV